MLNNSQWVKSIIVKLSCSSCCEIVQVMFHRLLSFPWLVITSKTQVFAFGHYPASNDSEAAVNIVYKQRYQCYPEKFVCSLPAKNEPLPTQPGVYFLKCCSISSTGRLTIIHSFNCLKWLFINYNYFDKTWYFWKKDVLFLFP